MPEGDTLYKTARRLQPALEGQVPEQVKLSRRRAPSLEKRIGRVDALGKHLLIEFDDGEVLRTHLGMHGSWRLLDQGQSWGKSPFKASVELWVPGRVAVCFAAKEVEFLHRRALRSHPTLRRLGPDILGDLDQSTVVERAREFRQTDSLLVDVLLDQRITCGIGNVYKNEVLFLERLAPTTRLAAIDDCELGALFLRAKELMERNLEPGHRVTTARSPAVPRTWVYGRSGRPCLECGSGIRYERIGHSPRDTYWCPTCQS